MLLLLLLLSFKLLSQSILYSLYTCIIGGRDVADFRGKKTLLVFLLTVPFQV